jgi:hypothetical protein
MDLTNTGVSIGSILDPIVTRRLIYAVGFNWTVRVITLLVLFTTVIGGLLLSQRAELMKSHEKRILWDFA